MAVLPDAVNKKTPSFQRPTSKSPDFGSWELVVGSSLPRFST
jgi:hypothetical protein